MKRISPDHQDLTYQKNPSAKKLFPFTSTKKQLFKVTTSSEHNDHTLKKQKHDNPIRLDDEYVSLPEIPMNPQMPEPWQIPKEDISSFT